MKKLTIILILAAFMTAFAAYADSDTYAESRTMVLIDISGTVTMSVGGRAEFPARAGTALRTGYTVRTGADGEAYFMIDDDKLILLAPNSAVVISQANDKLKLTLSAGELVFSVTEPQPEDSVSIDTAGVSMSIRGTSGYLRYIKDALNSNIKCGLFDGKVRLQSERLLMIINGMELGELPSENIIPLDTSNASAHALLTVLRDDMQIDVPDNFLSDEDALMLAKLWEEMLKEENEGVGFVGDNRYLTDEEIVSMAYTEINDLEYELMPVGTTENEIVEYINSLITPIAEKHGVSVSVNKIDYRESVDGGPNYPNGTKGEYDFNVTVTLNAAEDVTNTQTVQVAAKKFSGTSNMERLEKYKNDVENLNIPPIKQRNLTDESGIQSYIIGNITDSIKNDEVSVRLNCELVLPTTGDENNPNGVNGSYTYSVTMSLGLREITTDEMMLELTAKTYDEVLDELELEKCISWLPNAYIVLQQNNASTIESAREAFLVKLTANYLSESMRPISEKYIVSGSDTFTEAVEGSEDNPNGDEGEYSCSLYLRIGESSDTCECTAVIEPNGYLGLSYDEITDMYVEVIEGTVFDEATTAEITNTATLRSRILNDIKAHASLVYYENSYSFDMSLVSLSITNDSISEVVANGTRDIPEGTGEYTFTASVQYGSSTKTASNTLQIEREVYTGTTNSDIAAMSAEKLMEAVFNAEEQISMASASELSTRVLSEANTALSSTYVTIENNESASLADLVILRNDSSSNTVTTEPIAGTIDNTTGVNGTYSFKIKIFILVSGVETQFETVSLSLDINATPYDGITQDQYLQYALSAVEALELSHAYNEDKSVLVSYIEDSVVNALNVNTVDYGAIDLTNYVSFMVSAEFVEHAVAGTVSNPSGTNGSMSYDVMLIVGTNASTIYGTMELTTSPYVITDAQVIAACATRVNSYAFTIIYTDGDLTVNPVVDSNIVNKLLNQVYDAIKDVANLIPSASASSSPMSSIPASTTPVAPYIATYSVSNIMFTEDSEQPSTGTLTFVVNLERGSASTTVNKSIHVNASENNPTV